MTDDEIMDFFDYHEAGLIFTCLVGGCRWTADGTWSDLEHDGRARQLYVAHYREAHGDA